MSVLKSLWESVQGDPRFMRRLNGWLKSVTYVSALSLWALVSGHWSTWQAARVEVSQQKQIEKEAASPVEERVVEKLVEKTDVEPMEVTR